MSRRRGVSLPEILMGVLILSLLLGSTMVAMKKPLGGAGSRALADQVAETLRLARNQARAEQRPVAVVFPTGGTRAFSQSLALYRGEVRGGVLRSVDFSKEHPHSVIFVGKYAASGGTWSKDAPTAGGSNFPLSFPPGRPDLMPFRLWLGNRSDFVFFFKPDGTVLTNDLPHLNGTYRLVVTQGGESSASGVSGSGMPVPTPPPYHQLTRASDPYTILVSSLGSVDVVPGLADTDGSTAVASGSWLGSSVAAPLPANPEPMANPEMGDVLVSPRAGALAEFLGFSGTVGPGRQTTLRVQANVTTSDDLFAEISAVGARPSTGAALPPGSFSSPGAKRMVYLPPFPGFSNSIWVCDFEWSPPQGAVQGDEFTFTAKVTTRRGATNTTAGITTLTKKIVLMDMGRIFFGATDPYSSRAQIFMVRADGSDLTRVTVDEPSFGQMMPAATRDGNKILFCAFEPMTRTDLFALSRTGGLSTPITVDNKPAGRGYFSDDSSVCVFNGADVITGPYVIKSFDPNGTWPPPVYELFNPRLPITMGCYAPAISPIIPFPTDALYWPTGNGWAPTDTRLCNQPRRVAFETDWGQAGKRAIFTCNFVNGGAAINPLDRRSNLRRQTMGGDFNVFEGGDMGPAWHKDGQWIAFSSDRSGVRRIYVVRYSEKGNPVEPPPPVPPDPDPGVLPAPSGPDGAICLTPDLPYARDPFFSPDGQRICFVTKSTAGVWDLCIQDFNATSPAPAARAFLDLTKYTPFTSGFTDINNPVWSL